VDECKPLAVGGGGTGMDRSYAVAVDAAGTIVAAGNFHGQAVQVDPIKPTLKPSGPKHFKLKCDEPLSDFAFKCNLRRYTTATKPPR
jgi:hypothetical protein